MTSVLLRECGCVVTMDDFGTELLNANIVIEDGWIRNIGRAEATATDEVLDGRNLLVIPGLVNTHHHLYQTLTRGFPEGRGQILFDWLRMLYPIWSGLDEDMVRASTEAGLAELVLSGCTTCADHLYVFPAGSNNFIDIEIEAARRLGIRFHPTRGSMDLSEKDGGLPPDSVVQDLDTILIDSERVLDRYHDQTSGSMVQIGLAPCSPFSASPALMRSSAELAREHGARLHTHIAETTDEDTYSRAKFGVSPVELLEQLGWIARDVWVAHCVHPGESEIQLLAAGNVCVAHCPTSNMLLGSGLAPTRRLLDSGVGVGLGVDGSASNDGNDLKAEIKQAVLSARVRDGAETLSIREALRIATRGGAACLGRSDIGSLEVGKVADLVTFDADDLMMAGGSDDIVSMALLGSARPRDVMVNGRWIVRDGRLRTCEVDEIAGELNKQSGRLLTKWRNTGAARSRR